MTNYIDRIVTDYRIMLGKPIVKGTRITVETISRKLAQGASHAEVIKMYPELSVEDVNAALMFALATLKGDDSFEFAA